MKIGWTNISYFCLVFIKLLLIWVDQYLVPFPFHTLTCHLRYQNFRLRTEKLIPNYQDINKLHNLASQLLGCRAGWSVSPPPSFVLGGGQARARPLCLAWCQTLWS